MTTKKTPKNGHTDTHEIAAACERVAERFAHVESVNAAFLALAEELGEHRDNASRHEDHRTGHISRV